MYRFLFILGLCIGLLGLSGCDESSGGLSQESRGSKKSSSSNDAAPEESRSDATNTEDTVPTSTVPPSSPGVSFDAPANTNSPIVIPASSPQKSNSSSSENRDDDQNVDNDQEVPEAFKSNAFSNVPEETNTEADSASENNEEHLKQLAEQSFDDLELEDMDVILLRGFKTLALVEKGPVYGDRDFEEYWQQQDDNTWFYYTDLLEGKTRIFNAYWSSRDRLEDGILESVVDRIKDAILHDGLCSKGCIMISHSTGGFVADYLMARAIDSRGTDDDFFVIWEKTAFVVSLASATGGSELSELLVDVAHGLGCEEIMGMSLNNWFFRGVDCEKEVEDIGVAYDLIPNNARLINRASDGLIPTFMVSGRSTSSEVSSWLASPFLPGEDDSVVSSHSSCAATKIGSYDSCSAQINYDGTIEAQDAPESHYVAHYPWLLSEENHGQLMNLVFDPEPKLVEVLLPTGDKKIGTLQTKEESEEWILGFTTEISRIKDYETRTTAEVVVDALFPD